MSGTRVAVVSPDGRVRTSLHHLLTSDDRLTVLDPVGTALEAADVVVVDLGTGRPGSLRTLGGAAPLVVLGFDEPGHPVGSQDSRVFAYLSKSEAPDRLLTTVRAAAASTTSAPGPGWWGTTALVLAVLVGPWTVWFSRVAEDRGVIGWHVPQGLALWSITPVLLLTLGLVSGRAGLRDLGSRLVRWRVPARTYGVALGLPAVVSLLTAAIVAGTGGEVPVGRLLTWPAALVYLAYGTGLFLLTEEAGWRGTLLPRVQRRVGPAVASLVVGAAWAVWHLPLLAVPGEHDRGLPRVPFLVLIVATSVLVTGLVNAARGSVVVAAVFHASFDACYSYVGVVGPEHRMLWVATGLTVVMAAALLVATRGRLFLPEDAR
jgi:membrane protease YdiL (CAAX protease family)